MKFEKTYLSRAMTKAMSADHPIGDPTGGPAYGERNDPVSAIIAVSSMWTAGASIAAVGLTVSSGLMFAGGALMLVGNVTKNKKLMVLGGALALVGGVGGMMSDPGTGFNAKMSEAFSSTSASSNAALSSSVASEAAVAPSNVIPKAVAPSNVASEAFVPPTDFSMWTSDYSIASNGPATSATPSGMGLTAPGSTPNSLSLTGDVDPGMFKKATDFASKNPMAAMIIANAGSEFAGGVMDTVSGKSGAEAKQLDADAAYRTSVAAKTNREMALDDSRIAQLKKNLQALSPGQFNVNPNAVTLGPKPPGLIANARA